MALGQDARAPGRQMDVAAATCAGHVFADVQAPQVEPFTGVRLRAEGLGRAVFVTVHALLLLIEWLPP